MLRAGLCAVPSVNGLRLHRLHTRTPQDGELRCNRFRAWLRLKCIATVHHRCEGREGSAVALSRWASVCVHTPRLAEPLIRADGACVTWATNRVRCAMNTQLRARGAQGVDRRADARRRCAPRRSRACSRSTIHMNERARSSASGPALPPPAGCKVSERRGPSLHHPKPSPVCRGRSEQSEPWDSTEGPDSWGRARGIGDQRPGQPDWVATRERSAQMPSAQ